MLSSRIVSAQCDRVESPRTPLCGANRPAIHRQLFRCHASPRQCRWSIPIGFRSIQEPLWSFLGPHAGEESQWAVLLDTTTPMVLQRAIAGFAPKTVVERKVKSCWGGRGSRCDVIATNVDLLVVRNLIFHEMDDCFRFFLSGFASS